MMMKTMQISDAAFATLRDCLMELADCEFQNRVWVRGEGPEESSPSELVSQLYDDTGLGDLLEDSNEPVVSIEVDEVLRELSSRIDNIDLRADAPELLAQPQWGRITKLASEALHLIESGVAEPTS